MTRRRIHLIAALRCLNVVGVEMNAYIGDPINVELTITNAITGAAVTTATVTFTVKDASGTTIGTANHSMPHSASGLYRGTWPDDESDDMVEFTTYYIWITADDYTRRRLPVTARYREVN